jgi:hypothetical protein
MRNPQSVRKVLIRYKLQLAAEGGNDYGTSDGNLDTAPLIFISSISHRKFQLARNWMKNRIIRGPRPGAGFLVCV